MKETSSQSQRLLRLAKKQPLIRAKDFELAGISSMTITRAVRAKQLERVNRGVYRRLDAPWDENLSLSEVAALAPQAVIVLISALNFHHIGTHQAHSVWIQIKGNAVTPRVDYPPIEVVRSTNARAFTEGVVIHKLNGIPVPITSPARSVADCFKYRNRLGLELCIEALREVIREHAKPAEVLEYAAMNRVENIMIPYLEVLS